MLDHLDARAARRWALAALGQLSDQRAEIDATNVFPVADGDTGTNLLLTLEAGVAAVEALDPDAEVVLAEVVSTFARGTLLGARGNSGVIVSQLVRGWADVLTEQPGGGAQAVSEALRRGAVQAYAAVSRPVEGTMLTIARAAADGAVGATLAEVVTGAVSFARTALRQTPHQLDVLAQAGVVDAGGRGLLVLLEALAEVVTGEKSVRRTRRPAVRPVTDSPRAAGGPAYEVMYLLDADPGAVAVLRERLDGLGDSLVVVGSGGLWNVHVHTDDVAAAVEAGVAAGRPHRLAVTRFDDLPRRPTHPARVAVLATASGPGLAAVLQANGALVVGPAGRRPSTVELLEAVRRAGAESVVLLPDGPASLAAAQAAATAAHGEGLDVAVLPTRAAVQGLAAIAVHDASSPRSQDLVRMASAAAGTRHGAVTTAEADGLTSAGWCRAGQALGLVDSDVVEVGDDVTQVALSVASRMLSAGGELLTLVWGAAPGSEAVAVAVCAGMGQERRDVEVCLVDGGQPGHLLLGVE